MSSPGTPRPERSSMSNMEHVKRMFRGETNFDFIGRRNLWFALSGVVLLVSILAMPLRPAQSPCSPPLPSFFKGLNCGIEFKGGVSIQAPIAADSPLAEQADLDVIESVREGVEEVGALDPQIQVASLGDDRSVIVQTTELGTIEAQQAFQDRVRELTGATVEESSPQRIGRKWGGEISRKAFFAMIVFLIVISIFMSWRFEWKMGVAAIAAMFHDLIVTAGVYAIIGFELTPSTIIAILTILGYSLYDNVVVFDKVEENVAAFAATGKMTYNDAANRSLNEVFMRSLNTALATILPVAALLFVGAGLLGAGTLKDLSLALFVGLFVGTYSSVFFAVPILATLKEREPRFQNVREKLARDAARRTAALKPALVAEGPSVAGPSVEGHEIVAPARSTVAASSTTRPTSRPRAGTKKAKRRKRK